MTPKGVRYEIWLTAFVAATACLMLTSTHSTFETPHNNSDAAPHGTQADIISRASGVAPASKSGNNSSTDAAGSPPAEIASARDVDHAIYYWVGRTRQAVRRYWTRKPRPVRTPGVGPN